jgi:hypothetical protein
MRSRHAHRMVNVAIRGGDLTRLPCEICGTTDHVHAHHDDYSRPLDVRWLCALHHAEWHRQNGYPVHEDRQIMIQAESREQLERWRAAAKRDGRTLAGWLRVVADRAAEREDKT